MSVVLNREYIALATKLGLKSVAEYAQFIVDLNNFYKGYKR